MKQQHNIARAVLALCVAAAGSAAFAQRDEPQVMDRAEARAYARNGGNPVPPADPRTTPANRYGAPVADHRWDAGRSNNRWDNGPGYRHFNRGERLPPEYRNNRYVVNDWRGHHLRQPPRGYQWVQNGSDYLLVAVATGLIADLLLNN